MAGASAASSTRRSVVLIVEDDTAVREALADCLQEEGYGVASASNGRDALDYLRNNPPPCLILLDLFMPVMDGEDFCAEMARDRAIAGLPVIVLTAAADGRARAKAIGAVDYLRKPLSLDPLLAAVAAHC
jgi:CheY-like chemotaxis protein